jgi:hypothetical protein
MLLRLLHLFQSLFVLLRLNGFRILRHYFPSLLHLQVGGCADLPLMPVGTVEDRY